MFPTLQGVMLSQVDNEMKPQANSIANLSYNLIGYFPAPALYGLVCSLTGGLKSRWGMIMLCAAVAPAVPLLIFAIKFRK